MNPMLIVPTVEAAIQVATYIQSAVALYQAGHMTQDQLVSSFAAVGIQVKNANAAWDAAGGRTTAGSQTAQPAPALVSPLPPAG